MHKEVHNKEIVHRDINPNNILIINDNINISDFGLGKDLDVFHSHRTVDTHSFGQYAYCAPEQFMKLKDGNKKSDVYSLGSLINFIFTRDPSNKRHRLRSVVEKARNESPNIRFENAEVLLESVKQTIKYLKDKRREEKVKTKIEANKFDEDVENFIYELSGQRLCDEIISQSNFKNIIIKFMTINKTNSSEIMKLIEKNFIDSCSRYEHHDKFSSIAKNIIKAKFPFVSKEIAAKVLNYNANEVNRFHAQRIIEELIDKGVEPLIEDILEE
ncbi:protein kinase-like protein [Halanaerobium congolense]|uniref:Protein kinase-like protein n=1 Tax=Halanaerobium congolense TaxID=54121 RepID=A0A4R8GA02_9FIRM|nr:protein kinase [Halanaerobium congolense]TDX42300.1 protein kinase-like protein [Halanaerobium congolense]